MTYYRQLVRNLFSKYHYSYSDQSAHPPSLIRVLAVMGSDLLEASNRKFCCYQTSGSSKVSLKSL